MPSTFGNTAADDFSNSTIYPDYMQRGYIATLTEDGSVTKITIRAANNVASQVIRGVIYTSVAGVPTTFKGATQETTVGVIGGTMTSIDLNFASPLALTAGDYYIAIWGGTTGPSIIIGISAAGNSSAPYMPQAYSSSGNPTTPWSSGGTDTGPFEIYATYTPAAASQIVVPIADVSRGSWLAEPGDGTTNLYQKIDETSVDNTDYIQSSLSPGSADIYVTRLAPSRTPPKPRTDSTFHYKIDALKDVSGGDTMQITVKLYAANGSTLLKTWSAITLTTEATTDLTLTGAEADTIPDVDFAVGLVLAIEALKV